MPRPVERNYENVEFEECSGNTNNNYYCWHSRWNNKKVRRLGCKTRHYSLDSIPVNDCTIRNSKDSDNGPSCLI